MADFRKWIYALAVVTLLAGFTIPASAQTTNCTTASGVTPLVRAEGYTELMGDVILNCTGGIPTASGQQVPPINVQIFLSTNVTSRLLTNSGVIFNEALLIMDEPNSPNSPINTTPSSPGIARRILACGGPGGAPDNGGQGPGVCAIVSTGNPNQTYDGDSTTVGTVGGSPLLGSTTTCTATVYSCGRPNVFEGRQPVAFANGGQTNSVVWPSVPFDPPGSTTTRIMRITNVRGNAVAVGLSSTFTVSQIQMNISISGNNFGSFNTQQVVAYVQKGLNTTITRARTDFIQCNSENPSLYAAGNGTVSTTFSVPSYRGVNTNCVGAASGTLVNRCDPQGYNMAGGYNSGVNGIYPNGSGALNVVNGLATPTDGTPTVRFVEGFPTAWKIKNIAMLANATLGATGYVLKPPSGGGYGYTYPADQNQNVAGTNYNTESGYENALPPSGDPVPNPPTGYTTGQGTSTTSFDSGIAFGSDTTHGLHHAGVADHGTRLALNFTNVPKGASLWLPPVIFLYRQDKTVPNGDPTTYVAGANNSTVPSGVMVLTSTDANGGGAFSVPSSLNGTNSTALIQVGTSGLAVYEILYTDPGSLEQGDVPVVVAYNADLTNNLPQTGLATQVAGGFAPFYTASIGAPPSTFGSAPGVPRFVPSTGPATLFSISSCSCNLLFPFVANVGGFDTGIAIANTSQDPGATFGFTKAKPQVGTVQFWYYGSIQATGAPAPGPQTSNPVPAGSILTYVLSTGGGAIGASTASGLDNRGAGFEGYIIAQAGFQYCHAYAFISAQGAGPTTNGTSEGYLGIVLDAPGLGRTNQIGENDAH